MKRVGTVLLLAAALAASGAASAAAPRDLRLGPATLDMEVREVVMSSIATVAVREAADAITIELPADILFDFDKAAIRDAARPALAMAAALLRAHPQARVTIEGHADAKGSEAHNRPLSLRRAEAVRHWLGERESLALAGAKVSGFGASRPAVPNTRPDGSDDPDGRQRNRRVEIVIRR